ncbi:RING finger protein 224 [Spinachia spinachia]
MMGGVVPAAHGVEPSFSTAPVDEPVDEECPVCYQEYNQHNKCPRMLECLHVFCTECLERIQLCPLERPLDEGSTPALPCPLCRHLTPLETGNALCLPRNSRTLATVTQRVVLSLQADGRDARLVFLPTVSLRVQRMLPGRPCDAAEVSRRSRKTLFCVQLLAATFWVLFVIACVSVVVFGPHLFIRKL